MTETSLIVDPGFVHHRKIQAILGKKITEFINQQIQNIPLQIPDGQKEFQINNIYSRILKEYRLHFC